MNRVREAISEDGGLITPEQVWPIIKTERVEKIAACYCFLSGDVRYPEPSIITQKEKLTEFVASKRLTPVFFIDDFEKINPRVEFWRLVEEIRNKKVRMFIVTSLDRLSNRPAFFIKFLSVLKKHRVLFASLNEGLDTFTPAGTTKLKLHLAMLNILK